ncbi:chitobiase/beta-hexosaminidase C-terminal domain-containing protein [Pendulispora albinea]|uniref:Chitobiase/beta-hexosaminidase C-terminal domain-containing protein n=1 Tax=Pendulispora albinea TaxID=2741071 RepID=A0ABZ2M3Q0_9BACT
MTWHRSIRRTRALTGGLLAAATLVALGSAAGIAGCSDDVTRVAPQNDGGNPPKPDAGKDPPKDAGTDANVPDGDAGQTETVATPTFTPAAGTYDKAQNVTIKTTTAGATIRYTLNGDTPTATSTEYSSAISIASTKTLKAVAFKAGFKDSAVATAEYKIEIPVDDVKPAEFSPNAGTFPNAVTVTLSSQTPGATICYAEIEQPTCDVTGTAPVCTTGTAAPADGKIQVTAPAKAVHAVACKKGMNTATTSTAAYHFKAAAAQFDPASGTANPSKPVTATSITEGAVVHYTTGSDAPTCASPVLTGETITADTVIQAIVCKDGYTASDVVTAKYYVSPAAPAVAPAEGTYHLDTDVTITAPTGTFACVTHGAEPADPACGAEACATGESVPSVKVTKSKTIVKAITCKAGSPAASTQVKATYTLTPGKPAFDPPSGEIPSGGREVTITSAGATQIRYTTNGEAPTCTTGMELPASGKVTLNASATLKAVGCRADYDASELQEGVYTKLDDVAAVTIDPVSGDVSNTVSATLATTTAGAFICSTIGSAVPACDAAAGTCTTGQLVAGPVDVKAPDTTIHAIACKQGMNASSVNTATYTFKVAAPTFDPPSGTENAPAVKVASATADSLVHYTLDGSEPSCGSTTTLPGGTFPNAFTEDTTVKVIVCKEHYAATAVVTATYLVTPAAPAIAPAGGTYHDTQTAKLTAAAGATVCFTKGEGAEPADPVCSAECAASPVDVAVTKTNTTIKAIACKEGHTTSSTVAKATYVLTPGDLVFDPPSGTKIPVEGTRQVAITSSGAEHIYYRKEGPAPKCGEGTELPAGEKVTVGPDTVLKVIACKADYTGSEGSASYPKDLPDAPAARSRRAQK